MPHRQSRVTPDKWVSDAKAPPDQQQDGVHTITQPAQQRDGLPCAFGDQSRERVPAYHPKPEASNAAFRK